jgi:hypothetical protein
LSGCAKYITLRNLEKINYPISLDADCQIHVLHRRIWQSGGSIWDDYFFPHPLQRSCATGVVNVQTVDLYLTTKAQESFWLVDHVLLKVLCVCPCPPHDCSNRAVGRWGVVALW